MVHNHPSSTKTFVRFSHFTLSCDILSQHGISTLGPSEFGHSKLGLLKSEPKLGFFLSLDSPNSDFLSSDSPSSDLCSSDFPAWTLPARTLKLGLSKLGLSKFGLR